MRSRKVCPGSFVILTIISLEITVVPPVTALLSPPDSRTTGADSPVIAASLTSAAPFTTSPSPGITSFAFTRTRSFFRRSDEDISVKAASKESVASFLAGTLVFDCLRDAALAFPRPSDRDSAKFENITVSHSQKDTKPVKKEDSGVAEKIPMAKLIVVRIPPISTSSITGFPFCLRRSSFITELMSASRMSFGSKAPKRVNRFRAMLDSSYHRKMFSEWPHCKEREECKSPNNKSHQDCPDRKCNGICWKSS
ncbi:hypothetical protein SDC9_147004 [bioreactor metagenome]|uniref:Uncharacterized protein n=1 Tax=bioreactor metagenome TaxID=1076179 RepID=A0A645ED89_9ZZZZ